MARLHKITHPIIGVVTWKEIQVAANKLGKVCRWCFSPVHAPLRSRCGKQECHDHIWMAYSWQRCRDLAIKQRRFGPRHPCAICGAVNADEIDHIVPVILGGTGDLSNLRALCRECHKTETRRLRREKESFIAKIAPEPAQPLAPANSPDSP